MKLLEIIIAIIAWLIGVVLSTLVLWGLGNLVIWVFHIGYSWTIWHGLICEFVFLLLKDIFGRK